MKERIQKLVCYPFPPLDCHASLLCNPLLISLGINSR